MTNSDLRAGLKTTTRVASAFGGPIGNALVKPTDMLIDTLLPQKKYSYNVSKTNMDYGQRLNPFYKPTKNTQTVDAVEMGSLETTTESVLPFVDMAMSTMSGIKSINPKTPTTTNVSTGYKAKTNNPFESVSKVSNILTDLQMQFKGLKSTPKTSSIDDSTLGQNPNKSDLYNNPTMSYEAPQYQGQKEMNFDNENKIIDWTNNINKFNQPLY